MYHHTPQSLRKACASWRVYAVLFINMLCLALISLPNAHAETLDCNQSYTVASGDSLSQIAAKAYGDSSKYTLIYYANRDSMPDGPSVIQIGQDLRIPCEDESNADATASDTAPPTSNNPETATTLPTPAPPQQSDAIQLLTAGDYAPFTEPSLPQGGLLTELLQKTLDTQSLNFQLNWINDWSSHLDPLLKERKYDVGFPWIDPGCPEADSIRCEFLFSKPLFEMLHILVARNDGSVTFEQDDDVLGKTFCRPNGYTMRDLDRPGREWLKQSLIELQTPQTLEQCFDRLAEGEVDVIAINDFTAREMMARLGLQDKLQILPRELAINGLHALVHKSHPRATILISQINKGLNELQKSGEYDAIMDRHLMNHWKTVEALQQ